MKRTNYSTRCEACGQIRFGNQWIPERREKQPSYTPGLCPACRMRRAMALRRADPGRRIRP
jgi:hypothetical protein